MNNKNVQSIYSRIVDSFHSKIVGQDLILEGMMTALLCGGHVLLEGAPGLAKTYAVKTFAQILGLDFKRVQFTTDLLPSDILGTEVYNPKRADFSVKKGPLFGNVILADEINRAPSKVQSALLEAMQEYQITIGDETFPLDMPYLIMATQNPIEQEGTYPLPEAQIDRFMLKINIDYPTEQEESQIVIQELDPQPQNIKPLLQKSDIKLFQRVLSQIHIEKVIIDYIVQIVSATRNPEEKVGMNPALIECGVSPRGSIYLTKAARAHAFLQGRSFVTPDDVKEMAPLVLPHRILLSYEAEAVNMSQQHIMNEILSKIPTP